MSNSARFRQFALEVDRFFEREAPAEIRKATARIAADGYTGIVEKTPVLTGFAQNGWYVSVGTLETRSEEGQYSMAEALSEISLAKAYEAIHIASNVAYIGFLEDGSSQKAPAGMVGLTLAELETRYSRIGDA